MIDPTATVPRPSRRLSRAAALIATALTAAAGAAALPARADHRRRVRRARQDLHAPDAVDRCLDGPGHRPSVHASR